MRAFVHSEHVIAQASEMSTFLLDERQRQEGPWGSQTGVRGRKQQGRDCPKVEDECPQLRLSPNLYMYITEEVQPYSQAWTHAHIHTKINNTEKEKKKTDLKGLPTRQAQSKL